MNEKVVYIKVDGYVREWLFNRFGNPVRFPKRSYEHEILARHLIALPHVCKRTGVEDRNLMPVAVPSIHGKPWESHNYLTVDGKKLLKAAVFNLFELDLLGTVLPMMAKADICQSVNEFCRSRGISMQRRGAVIKRFYRIRRMYEENGIGLICKRS